MGGTTSSTAVLKRHAACLRVVQVSFTVSVTRDFEGSVTDAGTALAHSVDTAVLSAAFATSLASQSTPLSGVVVGTESWVAPTDYMFIAEVRRHA
jgi:hypothetical protein